MPDENPRSPLWNTAPTQQDEPLTIFGGLRALDVVMFFFAFFSSYLLLQSLTSLRYLIVFLSAIGIGVAFYLALLGVRQIGPEGFHWSFLHWFGVLPIRGATRAKGVHCEPF